MRPAALGLVLLFTACSLGPREAPVDSRPSQARASEARAITVRRGDSVWALSRRHGVSMRAIIDTNDLVPPFTLHPGQELRLPAVTTYTVAPGDTLYGIARGLNIGLQELIGVNRLAEPYTIRVGQVLRLPGGGTQRREPVPQQPSASEVAGLRPPLPSTKPIRTIGAAPLATEPSSPPVVAPPDSPVVMAEPAPPPRESRPAPGTAPFIWPVEGAILSAFGPKGDGLHNDGINIAAARGTPVRASAAGEVVYAGNELRGYGNLVLLRHREGWVSAYAHLEDIRVSRGEVLAQGVVLGTVGSSGGVDRPQLHFELRRGRQAIDPATRLPGV